MQPSNVIQPSLIIKSVKLRTLLPVKIHLLRQSGIFLWSDRFLLSLPPFPLWSILSNGRNPYVFNSTRSFTGRDREGGSGKSSYQLHTTHRPSICFLDTFTPVTFPICCVYVQLSSRRDSRLQSSPILLTAQQQHWQCACLCSIPALRNARGKSICILKYTSPYIIKKAKKRGAPFVVSTGLLKACSLAADGRLTTSFCHCFSTKAVRDVARPPLFLPTTKFTEVGKERLISSTDRNLAPFQITTSPS